MWLRFLIIFSIIGIAEYYSYNVVRASLRPLPQGWRIALFTLYATVTLFAWAGLIFFRQIHWANVPHLLRNITIAFVMGLVVGKVLIFFFMLIDDVRRLFTWLVTAFDFNNTVSPDSPANPIARSVFLRQAALLVAGLSIVGFTWGITNRYNYHVRRIRLRSPHLPPGFQGLKIVQVSDIHTGSFDNHEAVAHGIDRILGLNPDVILFTGDLVNNHTEEVDDRYRQIFSRLKAPLGVYSTLGNHDYGDYAEWPSHEAKAQNLARMISLHADMGWRLLMNEHVTLERNGDKIALIGIENWSAKANFPKHGDMQKAYHGLPEKNIPFHILLSHDPSHWQAQVLPQYPNVHLTLSGHTHGMQFGIDTRFYKWSPVQYMYKEWAGLYTAGDQHLYVNRGFGFLGYPGRLGIMPEITLIELG